MILSFISHSSSKFDNEYNLSGKYSDLIVNSIERVVDKISPTVMVCGFPSEMDLLFAEIAIKRNIELNICVYSTFNNNFLFKRWENVLNYSNLTKYIISDDIFDNYNLELKNKYICDSSDILLAIYDSSEGNTRNCLNYASIIKLRKIVINKHELVKTNN